MTTQPAGQNLGAVRERIREWIAQNNSSESALASKAGLHRSIVNKLLKGGKMEASTAINLYDVLHQGLDASYKAQLLVDMGLGRLITALHSPVDMLSLREPATQHQHQFQKGTEVLAHATQQSGPSPLSALVAYEDAQRLFSGFPHVAAAVAAQRIQLLINMGHYDRAAAEISHTETLVCPHMDIETRMQFAALRAWLTYDTFRFHESITWFDRLGKMATQVENPQRQSEAHHFMALNELALGRSIANPREANKHFHQAKVQFDCHLSKSKALPKSDIDVGFDTFRMAEISEALGHHNEAKLLRKSARKLFANQTAVTHLDCAESLIAGKASNWRSSMHFAERALDIATALPYSLGTCRSLSSLAVSLEATESYAEAIEATLTILTILPVFHDVSGTRVDAQVEALMDKYLRNSTQKERAAKLAELQRRLDERQGRFFILTQPGFEPFVSRRVLFGGIELR